MYNFHNSAPAASRALPVSQMIDPEAIAMLRELPGDTAETLLADLVPLFVQGGPVAIARMHACIQASDAKQLVFVAHSLKGSCAQFGSHYLREQCEAIEAAGKAGNIQAALEPLQVIQRELPHVLKALKAELVTP